MVEYSRTDGKSSREERIVELGEYENVENTVEFNDQNFINEEHYELSRKYHEQYQNAIQLNNVGVNHFEDGDYDKSRILFRDALQALRESTIAAASCSTYCEQQEQQRRNSYKIPEFITMTDDDNNSDNEHSSGNERTQIELKWSKCAPLHSELLNNMPKTAATTTQGNMFLRALFLIDSHSQNNRSGTILYQDDMGTSESKGILYNMALSYLYLSLEKKSPALLSKAKQLFEKIIQLQPSLGSDKERDGGFDDNEFYPTSSQSFSKETANTVDSRSEEFETEPTSPVVVCSDKFWSNFRFSKVSYGKIFNRMEKIVRTPKKAPTNRRRSKRHELILTLA